jgi:hypothetical protein
MEPIVEFLIWMDENPELIASITVKLMEQYHWTPRQVAEDVTILQLLELWDYQEDSANPMDGDAFIKQHAKERLKKCQQEQLPEPPPLRWRHKKKPEPQP